MDELPQLIADFDAAATDATIDPLGLAERITGHPLEVGVPDGATLQEVDVRSRVRDDGTWEWDWYYSAVAGPDPGDVDIDQEDRGPGSVALRETYDPIMAALAFDHVASTASDPGDPGGPNSVNHVYERESGTLRIAGTERVIDPVFIWLFDDLVGFDDGVETPGYRHDLTAELPPNEVPVRLLDDVIGATPLPAGAEVESLTIRSLTRDDSSFDAEYGLRYLQLDLQWVVPPDVGLALAGTIVDAFADPRLQPRRPSFFEEGASEPSMVSETSGGWRLDVLLLDRYPGTLTLDADDESGAELRLRAVIEPARDPLDPIG